MLGAGRAERAGPGAQVDPGLDAEWVAPLQGVGPRAIQLERLPHPEAQVGGHIQEVGRPVGGEVVACCMFKQRKITSFTSEKF